MLKKNEKKEEERWIISPRKVEERCQRRLIPFANTEWVVPLRFLLSGTTTLEHHPHPLRTFYFSFQDEWRERELRDGVKKKRERDAKKGCLENANFEWKCKNKK